MNLQLTKHQIDLVTKEAEVYRVFNPNYICGFSGSLWNEYKIMVKVYFKDDEFWKAEMCN